MAPAMDMDKQLPFRPFSLDTRKPLDGENKNKHMDFFKTFLVGVKLQKYEQFLKDVTYKKLLEIDNIFWRAIEEDIDWGEDETISKPAKGAKIKFSEIITQMKQRKKQLWEYNKEVVDSIKVEKLDEILKYLLRIASYPMEPAVDENVAGYICKILDNVLGILQTSPNAQKIGYFFTICAVILDLICGLNYVPFKDKYQMLKGMVAKLNNIAEQTGNLQYIRGHGENEQEKQKNKLDIFKSVRYFYLATKGNSHTGEARRKKANADEILAKIKFLESNNAAVAAVSDPIGVLYAERGHQSNSGSSVMVSLPEKTLPEKKGFGIKIFMGLFNNLVLKNKMPLEVLLSHKKQLPAGMQVSFLQKAKIKCANLSKKKPFTSNEYYQLPVDVDVFTIKNDSDLEKMIKEVKEVDIVGIDTESYVFEHSLQLIQIATKKACFLIRRKYVDQLTDNLLRKLGTVLSTKFIVVFAGSNDSENVSKFIPECKSVNWLDLQELLRKVGFRVYTIDNQIKQDVSLSDCVERWMKKPLCKDYTLSDWSTGDDLSPEQVMYASLDAWVLVPLFEAIQNDPSFTDMELAIEQSKLLSQTNDSIDVTL